MPFPVSGSNFNVVSACQVISVILDREMVLGWRVLEV